MEIELAGVFVPVGEPAPVGELPVGTLFMIPGTRKTNKYWRVVVNRKCDPYISSIVCKKISDRDIQEYMTDFPVPPGKIADPDVVVQPVKFVGR